MRCYLTVSICFGLAFAIQAGDESRHWAFVSPQSPRIPSVRDAAWPNNEIDGFVLARLEASGLSPSPRADRRTLIRRAYFDLIGLPPTSRRVRTFVADDSPNAYERLIDELLSSPRYGERWGRYWLDLARYSDTKGYVYGDREERFFVHAHVYRDWVIRALNKDLPYNKFLTLQIAADQLREGQPESLAAMGFLTVGRRFLGVIPDIVDDRIDVLTRTTQGLTVSCARCHDHKFDPIPTADYYSLYGVFTASTEAIVPVDPDPRATEAYIAYKKELDVRKRKLSETFNARRAALIARLRAQAPEYLAAVPDSQELPTDDFYEIREPEELIPTVVRYWERYLLKRSRVFDPVFEPWHRLAKLKPSRFGDEAPIVLRDVLTDNSHKLNGRVAHAFESAGTPTTLQSVAETYGRLLGDVDES